MALPVLDGNQTATTLSSVVTGGEHIVAHSVVSLGSTAISNITSAVSGANVTVAGTVTANGGDGTFLVGGLRFGSKTALSLDAGTGYLQTKVESLPAISGTVTVGNISPSLDLVRSAVTWGQILVQASNSAVTVNSSVFDSGTQGDHVYLDYIYWQTGTAGDNTIQASADNATWANVTTAFNILTNKIETISLPTGLYSSVDYIWPKTSSQRYWRIQTSPQPSGAQDTYARFSVYTFKPDFRFISVGQSVVSGGASYFHGIYAQQVAVANSVTIGSLPAISGTVTARLQDASGNNLTSTTIGGSARLNVTLASATTTGVALPAVVNVYAGSDSGTVRAVAVDSSGRSVVTVSNFPATQAVSLASTTVTVSALPSGALTTRFGSVTTANTAQITSAVTNTSRKYLLAQNISAGTVTIGIGFSPTTTQGIQLTAGGGLTFDAFCPTGAVYWLGAVTGAAFTILEG